MRAVVQRVRRARVSVDSETVGEIGKGLVVLLGVALEDSPRDADYLAEKIVALRICDDADGKMNLSVTETGGGVLVVSQFTLYGDVRRGLRPSWSDAGRQKPLKYLRKFVQIVRDRVPMSLNVVFAHDAVELLTTVLSQF